MATGVSEIHTATQRYSGAYTQVHGVHSQSGQEDLLRIYQQIATDTVLISADAEDKFVTVFRVR